jgi:hypothetical protein
MIPNDCVENPSLVKANAAHECEELEQIPNIGPSLADDLRRIGIQHPTHLAQRNGFALYLMLCRKTGQRHDPRVLDTFLAACDFMRGAPPAPWWSYTHLRKTRYAAALRNVSGSMAPANAQTKLAAQRLDDEFARAHGSSQQSGRPMSLDTSEKS